MAMKKSVVDIIIKDYALTQAKGNIKKIFKQLKNCNYFTDYRIADINKYDNSKKRKGHKLQYKATVIIFFRNITNEEQGKQLNDIIKKIKEDYDPVDIYLLNNKPEVKRSNQLIKNNKIPYAIKYHTLPGEDEELRQLIKLKPELLDEYERWEDILRYCVNEVIQKETISILHETYGEKE